MGQTSDFTKLGHFKDHVTHSRGRNGDGEAIRQALGFSVFSSIPVYSSCVEVLGVLGSTSE